MSIIQISKIQQRSGDLVDLPQLDQAELGFASDVNKLFIGKTAGNTENIEVLTAYSNIAFSQLDGALGNLDITAPVSNGQVLVYDGINWTNRGGNTGGYINLGEASNVSLNGGAIGYILTTDGVGNLSWSPKGVVQQNIQTISAANPGRITLQRPYPFPQGVKINFNNIGGSGSFATNLNGNVFYLKTVPGNLQLYDIYTDPSLVTTKDTTTYGTYPTDTGIVIWNLVSSTGTPGGGNRSIQFNSDGVAFGGDNDLTYDYITNTLTLTGNAIAGNVYANSGTIGASILKGEGGNISNVTAGNITGQVANALVAGTVYTAAQPNITSVGTLTSLTVSGNISGGNIAGIIRPTSGSGTAGIIFPADPGGGSGDLATIKYYAASGESTILELTVTNDADDKIYLNATGGTDVAGTLQTTAISTGASGTAGTITGNWTLTSGSRLQSTYADLAEYYAADRTYIPGTVLEFGGDKEVTLAGIESNKLAGVVSTDPAYVMNGNLETEFPVMVALIGRVPVRVTGYIRKGDMLVSAGNGLARSTLMTPKIGTVIGKAVTSKNDEGEGIIEVMVGRM